MRNTMLSICISSYNKGNMCAWLVRKLLTIVDDRFDIFICDDCSDDDTIQILRRIENPKVTIMQNEKNLGPCKNWHRTIDCGDGKYILHVLDRDDIDVHMIPAVLDLLEDYAIGGGYIGKSAISLEGSVRRGRFAIYPKGKAAFLAMAGVPIHPTGFLVNKKIWNRSGFKKFFDQDEKYGIYPHSYVLGITAAKWNMLYMPIQFYTYLYRAENKKSAFYQKLGSKNYWWLPDNVMKTANQLILYLYHFADDGYKEEFIVKRAKEGLIRATKGYRNAAADPKEMGHYGMEIHEVSKRELLSISVKYYLVLKYVLKKLEIQSKGTKKKINSVWLKHLKDLMNPI